MFIRVLREEDAQAFSTLRLEALETDPRALGSSPEEHRVLTTAQVADRIRPIPESKLVTGAFDDNNRLIGNIGFRREPQIKSRHKGMIWGVYLTPAYRGKGIAKNLLTATLDRIKTYPELLQVTLAVSAEQKSAWRLYHSAGFQEFGLELAALKIADDYVDEHWMVLRLRNHPQPPVPPPVAPGDESHKKKI